LTGDIKTCLDTLRDTIRSQKVGKVLPNDFYISRIWAENLCPDFFECLKTDLQTFSVLSKDEISNDEWNVLKISKLKANFSLLTYEDPLVESFPCLIRYISIDLDKLSVRKQIYKNPDNRFILHRKELLFSESTPHRNEWIQLTSSCEKAGLFAQPKLIGTRRYWQELLKSKGLALNGHQLVQLEELP